MSNLLAVEQPRLDALVAVKNIVTVSEDDKTRRNNLSSLVSSSNGSPSNAERRRVFFPMH